MVHEQAEETATVEKPTVEKPRRRRSRWRRFAFLCVTLVLVLVAFRLALTPLVRWYVNRTLDQSLMYRGVIGDVNLHLWRGAYSIEDIRLLKLTGNVPVPFFSAKRVDLAIEWSALFQGRVVGRLELLESEMNFVDDQDETQVQTGAGGPWLEIIDDLFPFRIDRALVRDGIIHFRAFDSDPPVDVYLSDLQGSITNLTNIHDETTPLFAIVRADALAMGSARLEYEMKLDPTAYRPTFQLALRLLGLDVTKTNALARAYGDFDFEEGWFDLVIEMDAKEGAVQGYIKPLFRNLSVFDLTGDADGNVFNLFWQALVGLARTAFANPGRDQVATVIPLRGDLRRPRTDLLATIGNLLRNAFIRAYLPKLHGAAKEIDNLVFADGLPEFDFGKGERR